MTSINNNIYSSYYNMASQQQQNAATGANSTPTLSSILDAADAADKAASSDSNSAYLLDLSPEAQQYMNSQSSATSATTSDGSDATFTLNAAQQASLNTIMAKYKDLPQTQDNYDAMQKDLKSAGIDTDRLSAMDQINTFNAGDMLIAELNGTAPDIDTSAANTAADEATKSQNFMQKIMDIWSATAPAAPADNGTVASTSGA